MDGLLEIKRPFSSGETIHIQCRLIDRITRMGFKPDTVTMTIYDVEPVPNGVETTAYRITGNVIGLPVMSTIVDSQHNVAVTAFVDTDGLLELDLTPDQTTVDVPAVVV